MMESCLHLYNEQEYFWWSTRNISDLTQANELDEVEDSLAKTENKWSKGIMLTPTSNSDHPPPILRLENKKYQKGIVHLV